MKHLKTTKRTVSLYLSVILVVSLTFNMVVFSQDNNRNEVARCHICGNTCKSDELWVNNIDEGDTFWCIYLFIKNSVSREILSASIYPKSTIIKQYLSQFDIEKIETEDYSKNPSFVKDIIDGKFSYQIPVQVYISDMSRDNVLKTLSELGCINCSDFGYVAGLGCSEIITTPIYENNDIPYSYNLLDVTNLLKYLAKWDIELDIQKMNANLDSKIDITDASHMLKIIAGWNV